jgi:acyl CoA:acetate/3-ketoacid CoA transferase beta subunit
VTRIVTDRGVLRRDDGVLRIAAVPSGAGSVAERVRALADVCGWEAETVRQVEELAPVTHDEVVALRRYDPERLFLA